MIEAGTDDEVGAFIALPLGFTAEPALGGKQREVVACTVLFAQNIADKGNALTCRLLCDAKHLFGGYLGILNRSFNIMLGNLGDGLLEVACGQRFSRVLNEVGSVKLILRFGSSAFFLLGLVLCFLSAVLLIRTFALGLPEEIEYEEKHHYKNADEQDKGADLTQKCGECAHEYGAQCAAADMHKT